MICRQEITTIRRRDPDFQNRVLRAYEYRCAICGFDIRMDSTPICLEAAHIKWHTAGGPDEEKNGLALCTLHHKLFDRGAFTFSEDMKILVSDRANGSKAFSKWLLNYHGQKLATPNRTIYQPGMSFRTWHVRETKETSENFHDHLKKHTNKIRNLILFSGTENNMVVSKKNQQGLNEQCTSHFPGMKLSI